MLAKHLSWLAYKEKGFTLGSQWWRSPFIIRVPLLLSLCHGSWSWQSSEPSGLPHVWDVKREGRDLSLSIPFKDAPPLT